MSHRPASDSYPESYDEVELPEDCFVLGGNKDHRQDPDWIECGGGDAGGEGGRAILAQSAVSTYS